MRGKQNRASTGAFAAIGAIAALAGILFTTPWLTRGAPAQNYSVLYSFHCGVDGAAPQDGLVLDKTGNLYSTTALGGMSGNGTVFKLAPDGTETVLHSFAGSPTDGSDPDGNLIQDAADNLYGLTQAGGAYGLGSVFKVSPTGEETVLYSFTGGLDGSAPIGGMVQDPAGTLYGVTYAGGAHQNGVLFKLNADGSETVLHDFNHLPSDGAFPDGGLIRDSAGNLYGTTSRGGSSDSGTVFQITLAGSLVLVHSFAGSPTDGAYPGGGHLLRDAGGSLYSAAFSGGARGNGMAFKLGSGGAETVLFNFASASQGQFPPEGLAEDPDGNLYGTTTNGGSGSCGCGVLFGLTMNGRERALHNFAGSPTDGANPNGDLIRDDAGNLYGTASGGGFSNCGVVFRLAP